MSRAIALFTSPLPGDEHLDGLRDAGLDPVAAPIGDADLDRVRVLLTGLETVARADMERYPSLGLIALSSTGFDNVDRKRWTRHGSTKHLFHDDEVDDKIDYTLNRQGEPMARFEGRTAPREEPRTK